MESTIENKSFSSSPQPPKEPLKLRVLSYNCKGEKNPYLTILRSTKGFVHDSRKNDSFTKVVKVVQNNLPDIFSKVIIILTNLVLYVIKVVGVIKLSQRKYLKG